MLMHTPTRHYDKSCTAFGCGKSRHSPASCHPIEREFEILFQILQLPLDPHRYDLRAKHKNIHASLHHHNEGSGFRALRLLSCHLCFEEVRSTWSLQAQYPSGTAS